MTIIFGTPEAQDRLEIDRQERLTSSEDNIAAQSLAKTLAGLGLDTYLANLYEARDGENVDEALWERHMIATFTSILREAKQNGARPGRRRCGNDAR